ncbi:MAG: glycosyltransferase family 4 protein [Sedimentisphaerales bacterium]|nr:glycosyltransferase family 4 protein [Sedimentisphaerales bacterium]
MKRKLLQRYSLVAATGERAAEYVQRLGFPKDCVFRVGNVIDNDHFSQTAVSSSCVSAEQTPSQISATHFLTVSRLSPEKNLGRLLRAYGQYRREGGGWGLVLVGSGPQEGQLRALAEDLGIPGVHFPGWKDYDEVPCYYARASCFILPSMSETWGLVVNEAMTCGLPVLVSRNCGCVPELCHDGENGYVFDPNSTAELTERMLRISASNGRLVAFGEASRRIIASFTPQTWAAGLSACINKVLQEGGSWTRQQ